MGVNRKKRAVRARYVALAGTDALLRAGDLVTSYWRPDHGGDLITEADVRIYLQRFDEAVEWFRRPA